MRRQVAVVVESCFTDRDDFASDGERIFFTISELSSSLWSAPLTRR
jgi:hypothetical protein